MAGPTIAEAILGVEIKGVGDLTKQLRDGIKAGAKEMDTTISRANKLFKDTMSKATDDAFGSRAMKHFKALRKELQDSAVKAAQAYNDSRQKGIKGEEKARLQGIVNEEKLRSKKLLDRMKMESEQLMKIESRRTKLRKSLSQAMDKTAKAQVDSLSSGIESAFSKFQSGSFGDIFSGAGKLAQRGAGAASKKSGAMAAKAAKGGKGAAQMAKMATALKGVGVALGAFAAVAGVVALLVKMFTGLEKQVKEFNKAVMEGAGAMDIAAGSGEDFDAALGEIRRASKDITNNLTWMTTGKEQMEILKGFNEAGLRLKDITKGLGDATDRMRAYQDATAMALTYSKLLGVSASQIAQDMGTLVSETGVNLEQVRDGFAKVTRIAMQSGFNVKRFYSTVLEATSGVHFWNVRIEEAAMLLKRFTDMLGKRPGTELFKSIQEGLADLDYKSRFKLLMTAGAKNTSKIYGAAAANAARKFSDTLEKNDTVAKAFENLGMKVSGDGIGEDIAKSFASMSEDEFAKTLSKLQGEGVSGEVLQQITSLRDIQSGAGGGLGAKAKAMGSLEPGAAMALKMSSFMGPLHKASAMQLAAFEDFRGLSGQQLESLRRLSRQFHGDFLNLQDLAEKQAKGTDILAENKKMAERTGFAVDKDGKVRRAQFDEMTGEMKFQGKEITDYKEMIAQQGDMVGEALALDKESYTKDQMLAQRIVQNTEPLEKAISIGIEGWLEKIYTAVEPLAKGIWKLVGKFLGLDSIAEAMESRQSLLKASAEEVQTFKEALSVLKSQKKDTEALLSESKDPAEIAVLEEKLGAIEKEIAETEVGMAGAKAARKEYERRDVEDFKGAPEVTFGSTLWEQIKWGGGGGTFGKRGFDPTQQAFINRKSAMSETARLKGVEGFSLKQGELGGYQTAEGAEEMVANQEKQMKDEKERAALREKLDEKGMLQAWDIFRESVHTDEKRQKKDQKFIEDEFEKLPSETAKEEYKMYLRGRLGRLGLSDKRTESLVSQIASDDAGQRRRGRMALGKRVGEVAGGISDPESRRMFVEPFLDYISTHQMFKDAQADGTAPDNDFLLRKDGTKVRFSPSDDILGAKKGGPIDKALGTGGKGAQISITINESHNPDKTYSTVKRVLRDGGLI